MQTNFWEKLERLFEQASQIADEKERRQFVEEASADNDELRQNLLELLENDRQENFFLDEPVFSIGTKIIAVEDDEKLIRQKDFAHYNLLQILGRGGMGVVYLAADTRLNRSVALKLLPASLDRHAETVARFRQEAHAASNVSHQNVAHIYDFGEFENRFYLAMEYVPGPTLRQLLKEKLIDQKRAVDTALQIAAALQAAHKAGIIHRDIKPENIVVMEDGLVKVLDFGLAKLTPTENLRQNETSLETVPGLILGTTAYMSPEQVRGQTVDRRADIWSSGVCLYEMLAGRRPFEGETASDTRAAILRDEFPPIPARINLSREFNAFFAKALAKDRLARFQTASDFLAELESLKKKLEKGRLSAGEKFFGFRILRPVFAAAFIFVCLAAALTYFGNESTGLPIFFRTSNGAAQNRVGEIKSIAILPFVNETGDKDLNLFGLGLAEDLSRGLGSYPSLQVKAFASSRKIKNLDELQNIREKLNAEAVLRGSISRQNDKLTINVELVDLRNGEILKREQISASGGNLLALRGALTSVIAANFNFSGQKHLVLSDATTRSSQAYLLYLEGKYADDRSTAEGTRRAAAKLEKAVALDPDYALALVALGDAYNLLAAWYGENPEHYFPLAEKTLEKAVAADPDLSEARTSLAKMKMDYERDFAGAEREFLKAIEINPNNALAHHWYGEVYLSAMGRLDESLRELETAQRLNPLSSGILTALAWTYIGRDEFEKAIEYCDKALSLNNNDGSAYSFKAMALMKLGRFEEAISAADFIEKTEGGSLELRIIYALSGQPEKTREYLRRLEKEKRTSKNISDYDLAVLYAALGEKDKAFELLEKEAASKSVDLLSIRIDPLLDLLRDDARFIEIEKKLNLPNK